MESVDSVIGMEMLYKCVIAKTMERLHCLT